MRSCGGDVVLGPAGRAVEVRIELERDDRLEWSATLSSWLLHCAGQVPHLEYFMTSTVHLRRIVGAVPPAIRVPGATHQLIHFAVHPDVVPSPDDPKSWRPLWPLLVDQQLVLPGDDEARALTRRCVDAVLGGRLPARPALSEEPWATSLIEVAAQLRGEHA